MRIQHDHEFIDVRIEILKYFCEEEDWQPIFKKFVEVQDNLQDLSYCLIAFYENANQGFLDEEMLRKLSGYYSARGNELLARDYRLKAGNLLKIEEGEKEKEPDFSPHHPSQSRTPLNLSSGARLKVG